MDKNGDQAGDKVVIRSLPSRFGYTPNGEIFELVDHGGELRIDGHGWTFSRRDVEYEHVTYVAPTSAPTTPSLTLSQRYPKYYKPVGELSEVDVYAVHQLFSLDDVSGCIHHASKKLLLSGVRTGGKTKQQDIREARDTLNRWLELNGEGE